MSDRNSLDLSDEEEDVGIITIHDTNNTVPQEISGTLSKWTNYIHGWQDRHIVVKDRFVSYLMIMQQQILTNLSFIYRTMAYYKSEQDTGYGCRGSVSLKQASIKVFFFFSRFW